MPQRCSWVPDDDPLYVDYHDREWGVAVHDDRTLFEFLILEGAQAGLSWRTILGRREGYRQAFAQFDPVAVARFTSEDHARLMTDPGIVRNRLKVAGATKNAVGFLGIQAEHGSFSNYLWAWTDGQVIVNRPRSSEEIPARTDLSEQLSADLKRRSFTFVGPTIMYAYLQAVGVVDDHAADCFRA